MSAKIMAQASADERGTVQALARELDTAHEDGRGGSLLRMLCCTAHNVFRGIRCMF